LTVEQCVNHIYSAQEMEKRREGASGPLDIGRVFSSINELIQHSAGRDLLRISCGKDCEIVLGETLFNDRDQLRTIRDSGVWTPETLSEKLGPLNEAVAASQRGEHVERPLLGWEFYLSGKIFIKTQPPQEAEVTAEEGQNPQPQNSLKKIEGQQVFRMAEFPGLDHLAQSQRVATREHMEEKWREYQCATASDPSDSKKLSNCRLMLGTARYITISSDGVPSGSLKESKNGLFTVCHTSNCEDWRVIVVSNDFADVFLPGKQVKDLKQFQELWREMQCDLQYNAQFRVLHRPLDLLNKLQPYAERASQDEAMHPDEPKKIVKPTIDNPQPAATLDNPQPAPLTGQWTVVGVQGILETSDWFYGDQAASGTHELDVQQLIEKILQKFDMSRERHFDPERQLWTLPEGLDESGLGLVTMQVMKRQHVCSMELQKPKWPSNFVFDVRTNAYIFKH
jgi:hypothetical protein